MEIIAVFSVIFEQVTQPMSFDAIQTSFLKSAWETLVLDSTAGISAIRRALNVKVELNANRKIVAGLELLEKTAGNLLQELFDRLQSRIPLAVLLSCVLNQNSGNTIRDVSNTINKVILSLQMDIESYSNFVRIYRGDYNESLHQKVEAMKRPLVGRFASCAMCGGDFSPENEAISVFSCGHSFHRRCLDGGNSGNSGNSGNGECPICRGKREEVRKKVGLAGESDWQTVKQRILPESRAAAMSMAGDAKTNEAGIAGIAGETGETDEEKKAGDEATRWREFKKKRREKEESSLLFIFDKMGGNQQQLIKLLEPPSLFSAVPEFPDMDPQYLIETPQPGSLPIKPNSKGECVLLLSSPFAQCCVCFTKKGVSFGNELCLLKLRIDSNCKLEQFA